MFVISYFPFTILPCDSIGYFIDRNGQITTQKICEGLDGV